VDLLASLAEGGGSSHRAMLGSWSLAVGAQPEGDDGTRGRRPKVAGGRATPTGTSEEVEQSGGSG
jgi:hypothetical protein